jgi:hypothetical protein
MKRLGQLSRISALFLGFVFTLGICLQEAAAQTVAIGHISAEVVESVSAHSNVTLNYNFQNSNQGSISANGAKRIEMGEVELNSGRNIACNVMMRPATVTDNRGNEFVFEPTTSLRGLQDTNRADGSQNLRLTANVVLASNQANGLYQGSYTMVFAYN